jgi:hypothetical protein
MKQEVGMSLDFDHINDKTGFANGNKFIDADEVRCYFTVKAQRGMFGADGISDQGVLNEMAETVIRNGWWMREHKST